jgi:biopolymer transport protein ExbD
VISVAKNGATYLNDKPVNINNIGKEVKRQFPGQMDVYVRGDKNLTWGNMAQIISTLDEAGLKQKMVTKPEDRSK